MNCEDVMKFSFAYLDGEFDARDRVELEAHLAMCGHCRDAVQHDATFRSTVRKHLVATPCDPEMKLRVQQRLASARRKARLSATLTVPMALAASAAIAFVGYNGLVASGQTNGLNEQPAVAVAAAPAAVRPVEAIAAPRADNQAARVAGNQPSAVAAAPAQPAAAPAAQQGSAVRLVAAEQPVAGYVGGQEEANTAPDAWPIPQARTAGAIKSMVTTHANPLPDEVRGGIATVQQYLNGRMQGIGAPPISEGTGVHLRGARFSQIAGHAVVVYRYDALGKPLTAIRFLQPNGKAPFQEPQAAATPGAPGSQAYGTMSNHLAGYTVLHVLQRGERFALVSEHESDTMTALLEPDVK